MASQPRRCITAILQAMLYGTVLRGSRCTVQPPKPGGRWNEETWKTGTEERNIKICTDPQGILEFRSSYFFNSPRTFVSSFACQ